MVSFREALNNYFHQYANFSGTSTRAEYWWIYLFNLILILGTVMLFGILGAMVHNFILMMIFGILLIGAYSLGVLIPTIALECRRYRDVGLPNWVFPIIFIAILLFNAISVMDKGLGKVGIIFSIANFVILLLPSDAINRH